MITAADLPLTSEGRIYHLDLLPEELGDFVITVGDPARVTKVSQHFSSIECRRHHREFVTHTGLYHGHRVSVISTGIGTPSIDIVLNELDALRSINLNTYQQISPTPLSIVRLGTTGGLAVEAEIGDVVISSAAIGMDNLMHFYQPYRQSAASHALTEILASYLAPDLPISPYVADADAELVSRLAPLGKVGLTLTCPGFYAPQARPLRAKIFNEHYKQQLTDFRFDGQAILNLEMETAAIYALGQLLGHACCSVAIVLANRTTGEFASNVAKLEEEMIAQTLDQLFVC